MTEDSDASNDARNANARQRMDALKARRLGERGAAVPASPEHAAPGKAGGGRGAGLGKGRLGKGGMGRGAGRLGTGAAMPDAKGAAAPRGAGRLKAILTDPEQAGKRKALQQVVKVLSETADDGTGLVEGTSFSKAGVAKLMDSLRTRAAGDKGQKGATMILRLLGGDNRSDAATADLVHGAQISRLQQLSKMSDLMKSRGK